MEVPDPDALDAEAKRLRTDEHREQRTSDELNDPDVLEKIAAHVRTLLDAAELSGIGKEAGFPVEERVDRLSAMEAYEAALKLVDPSTQNTATPRTDISI